VCCSWYPKPDVSAFLAAFSGSHRYVLDYLSDEVLARQPAAVQQFLGKSHAPKAHHPE